MEPFLEHNREVKRNINFYEHPAKDLRTPVTGHSSVYVIEMQGKYKRKPTSRLQAVYPQDQSVVLTRSSHLGETSDYKETRFNCEKPPLHSSSDQHSAKSKSKVSSKSTHKQYQSTLKQEAFKSQFAPRGAPNRAYVEDESDYYFQRPHRTKGSDNYGFSKDGNDRELNRHYSDEINENNQQQQPIEVQVQIVDRFVLVLGIFLQTNGDWKCRPFLCESKSRNSLKNSILCPGYKVCMTVVITLCNIKLSRWNGLLCTICRLTQELSN